MTDNYYIRLATAEDVDFIYELANDKTVRANSFSTDPIPYENHVKWYKRLLSDPVTNIQLIYMCGDIPVGQCRIKAEEGIGEIGVSIRSDSRGCGVGRMIFAELENWVKDNRKDITKLVAKAKLNNLPSINSMLGRGYRELETKSDSLGYREFELLL